jgi:dihydroneopterin aldolase
LSDLENLRFRGHHGILPEPELRRKSIVVKAVAARLLRG